MNRCLPAIVLFGLSSMACFPTTTRPPFLPEPTATMSEVQLVVPKATRAVAVALDADSIPVSRTEARDGWLETGWFDAKTLKPTRRRPLGLDVVKVRAWIDPSRPNYSNVTVEVVYRPVADPSRSDRELEQEVPPAHPVAARVIKAMGEMIQAYGGAASVNGAPVKPDTTTKKPGAR